MAAPSPPAPVAATGQELLEGYKRSRIDKRYVRLAGQMGTDVRSTRPSRMATQAWGHREPEKLRSSTTNGNGHRGDQRVRATMRMKTVATVGALASCVLASRKRHSVVGAAPPGSTQQVRFASGSRGGRAAALGVHTGAREGERQERTHKRNEHEFGPISTPLTGYNVLYGAVKRPDKHSPHGL